MLRYLPDWLYELLPYAYLLSGIITWMVLPNGWLSSLLLIAAGAIIWFQRRQYRNQNSPTETGHAGRSTDHEKNLHLQITWQPSYAIGHELIDRQHRRLFALGNDLLSAVVSKQPKADIELMLEELLEEIDEHFASEEAILGSPLLLHSEAHKKIHRSLHEGCQELIERFRSDRIQTKELIGFIVCDVIYQHIIVEDQKLKPRF